MTEISTICYNPSNKFLMENKLRQRYLKNTSFAHSFPAPGSFSSVPDKLCVASAMDRVIKTSAFRDGKSDEHVKVLEQKALIDVSSKFQPKFLLHETEATLNRLSKWIVTVLFGVFILWRHDAEALWFAAGSIVNAMFSIFLKKILNQKRPSTMKSDPGMPSSHAQSIFFTAMFIILSNVEWLGINEVTIISSGLALALSSYFSYLRVSQKLHTTSQVVVGAVTGTICSILWYWLMNAFVLDAFVSSLWLRIIIILGTVGICIRFLLLVIAHWA